MLASLHTAGACHHTLPARQQVASLALRLACPLERLREAWQPELEEHSQAQQPLCFTLYVHTFFFFLLLSKVGEEFPSWLSG